MLEGDLPADRPEVDGIRRIGQVRLLIQQLEDLVQRGHARLVGRVDLRELPDRVEEPIQRRDEFQARVTARILDAVPRFVRELAEVHLPGVRGLAEHVDVRARTEDTIARAGDHDRSHFRVLEADPLKEIVQLDVDAEVVRIELQFVAGTQAAVLVDVHRDGCHRAVERQAPVPVSGGIGLVVDELGAGGVRVGADGVLGVVHGAISFAPPHGAQSAPLGALKAGRPLEIERLFKLRS